LAARPRQLVIGRHPGCGACIPDPEVSSRHAVVAWSAGDQLWTLVRRAAGAGQGWSGLARARNEARRLAWVRAL
jgi:hypothetical protein